MHKIVVTVALLLCAVILALLFSGKRALVYEHKVNPGEVYEVAEHGDLGASNSASLHCKYFTGRSFVDAVFWYAPNNVLGKDSCPFVSEQQQASGSKSFASILGIIVQVFGAAMLLVQSYKTKEQLSNFKSGLTFDNIEQTLSGLANEVASQFYQQRLGFIFLVVGSLFQAYGAL